jgi:hypothetical protein
MDAEQTFAQQYPPYTFDLDMMKACPQFLPGLDYKKLTPPLQRPIDTDVVPGSKKARWSPNSFPANGGGMPSAGASPRDIFANYGYGPQAAAALAAQAASFNGNSPSAFAPPASPLYSTSLQTPTTPINPQMSPNTVMAFAQQQLQAQQIQAQQQQQAAQNGQNGSPNGYGFNGYNLLGMGMPGMLGGFPYQNQLALQTVCTLSGISVPPLFPCGRNSRLRVSSVLCALLSLVRMVPPVSVRLRPVLF